MSFPSLKIYTYKDAQHNTLNTWALRCYTIVYKVDFVVMCTLVTAMLV